MPSTNVRGRAGMRSTKPAAVPPLDTGRQQLERDARRWLETEIDFVPNPEFRTSQAEEAILGAGCARAARLMAAPRAVPPADLPSHLAALCHSELLSAEDERELFRAMNYLKYRANVLRSTLDPAAPCAEKIAAIQGYVVQAEAIRDHLMLANMRLVVSIVKNFVGPTHSFDDMLSEGVISLMHAVNKFDYDRGFRFSTYAYRAICRNALRLISQQKRDRARYSSSSDQLLEVADENEWSTVVEQRWTRMRGVMKDMLDRLDRRERFIIRGRFALGSHRRVRTFQCLADKLGVSKERVRQLEQRALGKLQQMAADAQLDELHEALLDQRSVAVS